MATRFNIPVFQPNDSTGATLPSAKLYFYEAGTTTPQPVYAEAAGTTPLSNPLIADGGGYFESFFLEGDYRVILTDASATDPLDVGQQIWDVDNVTSSDVTNAAETNVANTFTQLNTFQDVGIEITDTSTDPDAVIIKGSKDGLVLKDNTGTTLLDSTGSDIYTPILELGQINFVASKSDPELASIAYVLSGVNITSGDGNLDVRTDRFQAWAGPSADLGAIYIGFGSEGVQLVSGDTTNTFLINNDGIRYVGTIPSGTIATPPSGMAIGEIWEDTTDSSDHPILRRANVAT